VYQNTDAKVIAEKIRKTSNDELGIINIPSNLGYVAFVNSLSPVFTRVTDSLYIYHILTTDG